MNPSDHVLEIVNVNMYKSRRVANVHPFYIEPGFEYLELVTAGKVYCDLNGQNREFGCGALFWEIEGDHTISRTSPDDPYECLTVRFKVRRPLCRQVPFVTEIEDANQVQNLSFELFRAFHDDRVEHKYLCHYAYQRLFWEAYSSAHTRSAFGQPLSIRRLTEYVEENLRADLHIDDLARAAGVSPPHLHALCRTHLGTTPHQYLIGRRLQAARILLAGGDHQVKAIAREVGFGSVEVFCRTFRKNLGMTPTQYREKHAVPYAHRR